MASLKRTMIAGVDRVLASPGLAGFVRSRALRGVTILMYHKVLPDDVAHLYPLRNLVVSRSRFERHARWLAERATCMTLGQAMSTEPRERSARPRVCVTFDDGYIDNAQVAAPILDRAGLHATFFVTTGFVAGRPMWFDVAACAYDRLGASGVREAIAGGAAPGADLSSLSSWLSWLKGLPTGAREGVVARLDHGLPRAREDIFGAMGPSDLRDLASRGHEIASHTVTHPILPRCDDQRLRDEVTRSKGEIEAWIGAPVRSFCYPNGDADDRVVGAAREAGYAWACTTRRGINPPGTDPMRLRRRFITDENAGTPEAFAGEALGVHDALRRGAGRG